ncbi:MAG: haloacid dehalogenase type II [Candidatus Dormibacter sp.]
MSRDAPPDVKVLAFDVFGTVVDWRTGVITDLTAIAAERHLTLDAPALADTWRRRYQPFIERVRRREIAWAVLDDLHRAALKELVGEVGLSALTEADLDRLVLAWHRLPPWSDASAGLSRLRDRYVTATLSNGNMSLLVDLARHGFLNFDCILSTELVQTYKPDPRTYQMVSRLLAVQPQQVMMVAAHPYDLSAAAAEGLRTAFVRRPQEWGRGVTEAPAFPVDIMAEDFNDLATQLGV